MDDMSEVPQFVRAPIANGCDSISTLMDDGQHDDSDVEEIPDERIPRNSSASDDTKVTLLLKCKSKLDIDTINNIAKTLLQAPNCRWTCASAPSTQCHERTKTFEFTTSRSVVAGNTLLVIEDAATATLPYPEHVKGIELGFGKPVALATTAGESCQVRSICNVRMQQKLSNLLDHLAAYKPYAEVESTKVRNHLVKLARLFMRLDRLFAALFFHIVSSHGDCPQCGLKDLLSHLRGEIQKRQPKEQPVSVGDLGNHCEALLDYRLRAARSPRRGNDRPPEYMVTHGNIETLLEYLQNGLEIPYWKIMLEIFSAFQANESTLASEMLSLKIHHMRSEACAIRRKLQDAIDDLTPGGEDVAAILTGVDKRISVLRSFVDDSVSDQVDDRNFSESLICHSRLFDQSAGIKAFSKDYDEVSSDDAFKSSSILTALIMITMIGAFVPFVKGFAISSASTELGTKGDSDYWYNISNSVTAIMGNFVMVLPLLRGSWFSAPHVIMWIWFAAGLAFASLSIVTYPLCNTGWSSLLAFFATIAGFSATLSITVTVGKDAKVVAQMGGQFKSKVD